MRCGLIDRGYAQPKARFIVFRLNGSMPLRCIPPGLSGFIGGSNSLMETLTPGSAHRQWRASPATPVRSARRRRAAVPPGWPASRSHCPNGAASPAAAVRPADRPRRRIPTMPPIPAGQQKHLPPVFVVDLHLLAHVAIQLPLLAEPVRRSFPSSGCAACEFSLRESIRQSPRPRAAEICALCDGFVAANTGPLRGLTILPAALVALAPQDARQWHGQ